MLILEARSPTRTLRWPLPRAGGVFGRDPECDFVFDDPHLSRRHVRIRPEGNRIEIEDLGSRNGLFVADSRVERAAVVLEDVFTAGPVQLVVREGVTLGASDGTVPARDVRPPSTPAALPRDTSWSEELAAALEGPRDGLLDRLLAVAAGGGDHAGALLVARQDDRWLLLAGWGRAPSFDVDALPLDRREPEVLHGRELSLLVPLSPPADGALLVYPCESHVPAAPLRAVAALCSALLPTAGDRLVRPEPASPEEAGDGFVTVAESCRSLLADLDRVARTDLPVLLCGPSGTGKELLARRVHDRSPRSAGPFVALNCAAFPAELLEAELFGIERGVATGVSARPGRFAHAAGGTLFLDEVGEFPEALQPKLLRALDNGEITPLGAPKSMRVDVRVVAATNRRLESDAERGRFRADLLYRLAGARFVVPPLRERPEDILPLARLFAREAARAQGQPFQGIDVDAARRLLAHEWPGNVRELRHAIARAVALADGPILHGALLPETVQGGEPARAELVWALREDYRAARRRFDRTYFEQLLARCEGNRSAAARAAGLSRAALYEKLDELGLR